MVTLIGVAPSDVYDLLRQDAPAGQGERNFPADWQRQGLIDRAWIVMPSSVRRGAQTAATPVDEDTEDDDWPFDRWLGL